VYEDFLVFSPDGSYLLIGGISSTVTAWNLPELERQYREKQAAIARAQAKKLADSSLPVVSQRITVELAMKGFRAPSTMKLRKAWIDGLNDLAKQSPDGKIDSGDAWQLYEKIKDR
jgi:hypothetical protein